LIWVCLDRSVWPWDQAWYGEVTVDLYHLLAHDRGQWFQGLLGVLGSKAPGIAWVGQLFVPLGERLGSVDLGLHLSVLVTQFLTLLLIYAAGRELCGRSGRLVPLAGCVLVGTTPLFVAMSHQYLVEPQQTLAVAWVYCLALFGRRWPRPRLLAHLFAAGTLALLAKMSSPLYCLLPGLMAVVHLFLPRRGAGRSSRLSLCLQALELVAGLAFLLLTAAWYYKNFRQVYTHSYQSAVGEVALQYGTIGTFGSKAKFWWAAVQNGLFTPLLCSVTVFLILAAVVSRFGRFRREGVWQSFRTADWLALFAFVHLAGVFVSCCLSINEETRYLAPCLPAMALLLMWGLTQLPGRAVGIVLVLLGVAQGVEVHAITLGYRDNTYNRWLRAAERDPTHAAEVEQLVARTSAGEEGANHVHVVGVELPWFNANSFNYYAAKNRLGTGKRAYYTSLGYAQTDTEKALAWMESCRSVYFISLEPTRQPQPPDFLNQVALPVLRRISQDEKYTPLSIPSTCGVVVFKRAQKP
jgi:hypothetical protein